MTFEAPLLLGLLLLPVVALLRSLVRGAPRPGKSRLRRIYFGI